MSEHRVALCRELPTSMGTFSAGCVFRAERDGEDWRLNLLPSPDGGFGHTVTVAADEVRLLGARPAQPYGLIPAQLDQLGYPHFIGRGVV